ncbi:MAG TPA: peptide chain release factor 1 [Candidatus Krumholzibacteria bacterium]|nr:peptide chain release factor 1 [Candidatus Krumholzibacteria bacterium]
MITPEKLQGIISKFESIEQQLGDPEVLRDARRLLELSREHARLRQVVEVAREYSRVASEREQATELQQASDDAEMRQLARQEADALRKREAELHAKLELLLVPPDPLDEKSTIVEIRAGTGGDEAALFAADLARMYHRFAERRGWKIDVLSSSPTGIGGFKEIIFSMNGPGAYGRLRFESGVHRVQRVPETEASGRIHTSTATVAVLPEVEAVEVDMNPADLQIETMRAGGPGGQHVNTSDSAVRIVHVPTGIEVRCQDERSQLKNREKALKILRSRLYEAQRAEQQEKRAAERKNQIGTAERSDKIRTYNFPQSRLTDHRIGLSVHNLTEVLDGDLDDVIQALVNEHQRALLAAQ